MLTVVIAAITGAAMYLASYLTQSLGQSIGNDLRVRLYHHLQELSLAYHGANRVGTMLSTLTRRCARSKASPRHRRCPS